MHGVVLEKKGATEALDELYILLAVGDTKTRISGLWKRSRLFHAPAGGNDGAKPRSLGKLDLT